MKKKIIMKKKFLKSVYNLTEFVSVCFINSFIPETKVIYVIGRGIYSIYVNKNKICNILQTNRINILKSGFFSEQIYDEKKKRYVNHYNTHRIALFGGFGVLLVASSIYLLCRKPQDIRFDQNNKIGTLLSPEITTKNQNIVPSLLEDQVIYMCRRTSEYMQKFSELANLLENNTYKDTLNHEFISKLFKDTTKYNMLLRQCKGEQEFVPKKCAAVVKNLPIYLKMICNQDQDIYEICKAIYSNTKNTQYLEQIADIF